MTRQETIRLHPELRCPHCDDWIGDPEDPDIEEYSCIHDVTECERRLARLYREQQNIAAVKTDLVTKNGERIYDLDPLASDLWAIAGPDGLDPNTVSVTWDDLPDGYRWLSDEEWSDAVERARTCKANPDRTSGSLMISVYALAVLASAGCLVLALMRAGDGQADILTTALWMAGCAGTICAPTWICCRR